MHCEITTGTTLRSESVPAFLSSSTSLPWLSSSWLSWNRYNSCPCCCPCCCCPLHLCHDRLRHDQVETGIVLFLVLLVVVVLYTFAMIVLIMIKLKQVSCFFGFPSSLSWFFLCCSLLFVFMINMPSVAVLWSNGLLVFIYLFCKRHFISFFCKGQVGTSLLGLEFIWLVVGCRMQMNESIDIDIDDTIWLITLVMKTTMMKRYWWQRLWTFWWKEHVM